MVPVRVELVSQPVALHPLPAVLQLPSRVAHNWSSMVISAMFGVLSGWYIDTPDQTWAQQGGLLLPGGLQLWVDRQGVGWKTPRYAASAQADSLLGGGLGGLVGLRCIVLCQALCDCTRASSLNV